MVTRSYDRSEIEIEVTRPLISRSCGLESSSHRRIDGVGEYARLDDHVDIIHQSITSTSHEGRVTEHGAVPARWGSGEPTRTRFDQPLFFFFDVSADRASGGAPTDMVPTWLR